MQRFGIEFGVVIKKKWYEFIRNPFPILALGISGIIFTILTGVISIIVFKSWNDTSAHNFDWSSIKKNGDKFAIYFQNPIGSKDILDKIVDASELAPVIFNSTDDLEQGIFDNSDEYAFGLMVTAFNPTTLVARVYYNNSLEDVELGKTDVGVGLMKILFSYSQPTTSIDFEYLPLNSGFSTAMTWSYFGPILMGFAINNIANSFANTLVADRENYRLHTMITSGLRQWIYWCANFLFDWAIYLILVIINWIILFAFNTPAIRENNWTASFFLFVFCSFQTLPMIYFLSLFFDKLQSVSGFMLSIVMVIILIPYFVVTLFLNNEISDTVGLIISIVPSFSLQHGLTKCAQRSVGKPMDLKEVWTGNYVGIFGVQIGSGIVFMLIGVMIHNIRVRSKGKKIKEIEADRITMDDDVQEVENEVLSGEHDEDAIVVKHLDKIYVDSNGNAFKAVNDVSMYVKEGELFGVLGANGAGKTTLMSVITGKTNATSGEILLLGNKVSYQSDAQKFVSICPQFDNHLFPFLTPRQHFEIYGKLKGYDKDDLAEIIEEYESLMNLGPHKNKRVNQLSGGNARKLGISLAFLGNSPIVFLDEPTASLDPVARIQAQNLIQTKANGRTVLLCTHLLSEAEQLCDRMCIMLSGQVHAIGTHQHLSDKFGTKWKVELGLDDDSDECRNRVNNFMQDQFKGAEIAGTRYATATYNIPTGICSLAEVFMILDECKNTNVGFSYFTCSMSTLERVFIDLVIQAET